MNRTHDRVVALGILLRCHVVLKINLVEHLPIRHFVVVAGIVPNTVFIGEAAIRIPAHQPCIVVTQIFAAGVAQLCALRVVPVDLIRIVWISGRLFRLEEPRRNCAEI